MKLPRRSFVVQGAQAAAVLALVSVRQRAAHAASCVQPASESLRESLNYADPSPEADEPCSRCGFYTPQSEGAACGHCMIFNGPVSGTAHCDSWSQKG